MAARVSALLLLAVSTSPVLTLQVTPNSKCASVCTDYYGADASDPNASNTKEPDVVCSDSDYSTTVIGFKYRSCVDCLQNSKAVSSGETDQAWFLCKYDASSITYADTKQ